MAVRSIEEAKVEAVKRLEVLNAHENVLRVQGRREAE